MPTSKFQPIRLLDPSCSYKFKYLMTHSADPDQCRSQLIWIYTVCKGRVYWGSTGLGSKCYVKKIKADGILIFFKYFFEKIRLGISCESSPWQMIHMYCVVYFL